MDRCDRCCQRARTWWTSDTDPDGWQWCLHHDHEYTDALVLGGYEMQVEAAETSLS